MVSTLYFARAQPFLDQTYRSTLRPGCAGGLKIAGLQVISPATRHRCAHFAFPNMPKRVPKCAKISDENKDAGQRA